MIVSCARSNIHGVSNDHIAIDTTFNIEFTKITRAEGQTIKTTVDVDVNMYSPQIGQSHSVLLSMHLWNSWSAMDMQTPHFCQNVSQLRTRKPAYMMSTYFAMKEILP